MSHEIITMDHGSGGGATAKLIEELLVPAFQNEHLSALGDGAVLDLSGPLVFSTDNPASLLDGSAKLRKIKIPASGTALPEGFVPPYTDLPTE